MEASCIMVGPSAHEGPVLASCWITGGAESANVPGRIAKHFQRHSGSLAKSGSARRHTKHPICGFRNLVEEIVFLSDLEVRWNRQRPEGNSCFEISRISDQISGVAINLLKSTTPRC